MSSVLGFVPPSPLDADEGFGIVLATGGIAPSGG